METSRDPGGVVREARQRHRLSQATLALRAGTTQTAISRLERGHRSPTVETIRELLLVMGEELVLDPRPLPGRFDPAHLKVVRDLTMAERLERAFGWTRLRGAVRRGIRRGARRRRR